MSISLIDIAEPKRRYDPPEMETNQLLLVSSIGLFINLWGMYATGGHHHHGHTHGHSHSQEGKEKKVGDTVDFVAASSSSLIG